MKHRWILVVGVMQLAGCAMGWTRPDTTASEFYQDKMQGISKNCPDAGMMLLVSRA